VSPVLLAPRALLVLPDQPVLLAPLALPDQPVLLAPLALMALMELLVRLERPVQTAQMGAEASV
jgi:hypothetical protein